MIVVTNTSPLIGLERINRLHLLPDLFGTVIRPESVAHELGEGQQHGHPWIDSETGEWLQTVADPPEMVLRKELGAGETAAIALAVKRKADVILLDDLAARVVAEELELNVLGTLGVLLLAEKRKFIESAYAEGQKLVQTGFRVSIPLLESLKRQG